MCRDATTSMCGFQYRRQCGKKALEAEEKFTLKKQMQNLETDQLFGFTDPGGHSSKVLLTLRVSGIKAILCAQC